MKSFLLALAMSLTMVVTANAQTVTQTNDDGKEIRQDANDHVKHSKKKHDVKVARREERKAAKHNKTTDMVKPTKEAKTDSKAVKRDEAASRKNGAKSTNKETYPLRKHH